MMSRSFKRHEISPAPAVPGSEKKPGPRPVRTVPPAKADKAEKASDKDKPESKKEIGGPSGPEPTRYGDWEVNGRCIDF